MVDNSVLIPGAISLLMLAILGCLEGVESNGRIVLAYLGILLLLFCWTLNEICAEYKGPNRVAGLGMYILLCFIVLIMATIAAHPESMDSGSCDG